MRIFDVGVRTQGRKKVGLGWYDTTSLYSVIIQKTIRHESSLPWKS